MGMVQTAQTQRCYHNAMVFSEDSFSKLSRVMYEQEIHKGEWVFLEGDRADKLYFLKKGLVKMSKTSDDGKELALYYYQPGDFLGEFAGMDAAICSFGAKAVQNSIIGIIDLEELKPLLSRNGELAFDFVKWATNLHRFTQYKLRDLLFYGKEGALASTLIRMANSYGKRKEDHIYFSVNFTNRELSEIIGTTRETVNRMLRQLREKDVIDYHHGAIVIKNIKALKEICHCENCPLEICHL